MENSLESKVSFKEKIISFIKGNKIKLFILLLFIIVIIASILVLQIYKNKKNILISDKYVIAEIYLNSNKTELAKNIFEEIILSQNEFYSILSLNKILEKNLETDENKILNYFKLLEKNEKNEELKNLITVKKALYLIKEGDHKSGNELLKKIISDDSNLKSLANEIITK